MNVINLFILINLIEIVNFLTLSIKFLFFPKILKIALQW